MKYSHSNKLSDVELIEIFDTYNEPQISIDKYNYIK